MLQVLSKALLHLVSMWISSISADCLYVCVYILALHFTVETDSQRTVAAFHAFSLVSFNSLYLGRKIR